MAIPVIQRRATDRSSLAERLYSIERKDFMRLLRRGGILLAIATGVAAVVLPARQADSACCYFSAKDKDILQPAQKAFITWDPVEKVESFTVQPRFEGNAADFGM